eukprot:CAMPEP_0183338104 /NCGR_PEP_ID=MMETSP0164_2-20130417/5514_1 /TAXON_ID=221442 /ORGANISM="Coccolithus pelagicus ssp braarudi, Strain PLY182g" /LENGTH=238 /DNA_ID=CAMNT_0025507897 /DNA_START=141 /DNA_END=857 /DNA_ORIENTATION=+
MELAPFELALLNVGEELQLKRVRAGRTFVAKRASKRPHAFHLRGLLDPDECDQLIRHATETGLHPAETAGGTDARKRCDVCCLGPSTSPFLKDLTADLADVLFTASARAPGGGCEDLHILRYEAGGEFELHFDASPQRQRALTILYYLNGRGATWFPLADREREPRSPGELQEWLSGRTPAVDGLHVTGSIGDALAFFNFAEEGELDLLTLHAGLPAPATRWVAAHFFHAGRGGLGNN